MRCQRCPKPATLHIIEVHGLAEGGNYLFDEYHFCEECARKHLYEPVLAGEGKVEPAGEGEPFNDLNARECPHCGIKFKDFRGTGRLGCANDYEVFREELMPLLENIHGEKQHIGKAPRRRDAAGKTRTTESTQLRKLLHQAVNREDYEEAARLRDQIRRLEEGVA
jgi:protein arginine kinase activator